MWGGHALGHGSSQVLVQVAASNPRRAPLLLCAHPPSYPPTPPTRAHTTGTWQVLKQKLAVNTPNLRTDTGFWYEEGEGLEPDELEDNMSLLPKVGGV